MRLDQERQKKLEPERMDFAEKEISKRGYKVIRVSDTELNFEYNGGKVMFFPYSGWAAGSTVKNGRGLKNLLKQLT